MSLFQEKFKIVKNNNHIKLIPIITYINVDKHKIYEENRRRSGIYRWNNLVTNMSYIGSAINLARRLRSYFSLGSINKELLKGNSRIHSALLKYGYDNFSLDILEYCEPNILISREQYYIDVLNSEYNILKIAGNRLGFKHSEVTIKKMSGINNHFYGKTHSYETRKMIGDSLRGIIRVNNKPKIIKPETKLKLSFRSHGVSVKVFDKSNNFINEFSTITSVAKYFGVHRRTISNYLDKSKFYNEYILKSNIKDNTI